MKKGLTNLHTCLTIKLFSCHVKYINMAFSNYNNREIKSIRRYYHLCENLTRESPWILAVYRKNSSRATFTIANGYYCQGFTTNPKTRATTPLAIHQFFLSRPV